MGGWKRNPDWYYNLAANPDDAWIEVGTGALIRTVNIKAVVAQGAERDALFGRMAALYPQFDYYQGKTKRVIPVVILEPR